MSGNSRVEPTAAGNSGSNVGMGRVEEPYSENDTMLMVTYPSPEELEDDDGLKLRLLVPHIALASFLILLALASFVHYHVSNKDAKADGKFTEELKSTLRRPRAAQGFPSTLVQYFGLGAIDRENFDFTAHLNRIGYVPYCSSTGEILTEKEVHMMNNNNRQGVGVGSHYGNGEYHQNNHLGVGQPSGVHSVAPSGSAAPVFSPRRASPIMQAGFGLANHGFVEDEFKSAEYYRRLELTMSPSDLVDSPLTPHRDAGSFQTSLPANNKNDTPKKRITTMKMQPYGRAHKAAQVIRKT